MVVRDVGANGLILKDRLEDGADGNFSILVAPRIVHPARRCTGINAGDHHSMYPGCHGSPSGAIREAGAIVREDQWAVVG